NFCLSMDPTKKNNRGTSKIFTCFNPLVDDDDDGDNEIMDNCGGGGGLASPPPSSESGRRRKKKLRKSKSESSKQDHLDRPSSNLLSKSKKLVKSVKKSFTCKPFWEPHQEIFRINSNHSSSIFSSNSSRHRSSASSMSSSSISSLSSNSGSEYSDGIIRRSVSLDFEQMSPPINSTTTTTTTTTTLQKPTRRDCGRKRISNYCNPSLDQMCIFLVWLGALVFWGKVFAIVTCTSTWLFVYPGHRFQRVDSSVNDVSNIVDSEEYKKRVVMEGLLERNRSI
ncbi:hypothetical protein MIMGU_mgv11b016037mg, partial [Erythranthe guttata]